MDDQESSSGLMIGMIVGGVAAVVLLGLVVLGGAFFWPSERTAVAPAGGPVVAFGPGDEEVAQAVPPIEPAPQPRPDVTAHNRLVGVWEAKTPDDGVKILDLRADGAMQVTMQGDGKTLKRSGRWEVLEADGERVKLRRALADNTDSVQTIRFDGPDRFIMEGPGGGAAYQRRAAK